MLDLHRDRLHVVGHGGNRRRLPQVGLGVLYAAVVLKPGGARTPEGLEVDACCVVHPTGSLCQFLRPFIQANDPGGRGAVRGLHCGATANGDARRDGAERFDVALLWRGWVLCSCS